MKDTGEESAIAAARGVMAAHLTALNARNEAALAATMHFPHYRLSLGRMTVWENPDTYFSDFRKRAGDDWDHTRWDAIDVLAATPDKVHLDVRFSRLRADESIIAAYRSLWVIAELDGVWAAQLRSSFAN